MYSGFNIVDDPMAKGQEKSTLGKFIGRLRACFLVGDGVSALRFPLWSKETEMNPY